MLAAMGDEDLAIVLQGFRASRSRRRAKGRRDPPFF